MQESDRQLEVYRKKPPQAPEIPVPRVSTQAPARRRTRKARDNEPRIPNLEAVLTRICGVNLCSIDGINIITAQTIIAEIGTDMKAFPSEKNFASWLGLTPGKDTNGGKVVGKRRKAKNRVAAALRIAATSLMRCESYLGTRSVEDTLSLKGKKRRKQSGRKSNAK
jgi:transposase